VAVGGGTVSAPIPKLLVVAPSAAVPGATHGEAVASGGGHQDDLLLVCQTAASGVGQASASLGLYSAHQPFVLLPHGSKE